MLISKILKTGLITLLGFIPLSSSAVETDSLLIRAYTTNLNNNRSGLSFAYSTDGKQWIPVADHFSFLRSDYGPHGLGKRMLDPQVFYGTDEQWYCLFNVDEQAKVQGITSSADLVLWKPQDYFPVGEMQERIKKISFTSSKEANTFKVPRSVLNKLINHAQLTVYRNGLYSEQMKDDAVRFAALKPFNTRLKIDFAQTKKISQEFIGIFFEDINYAADGGLYAELVQNRDFEYSPKDNGKWNSLTAWDIAEKVQLSTAHPVHVNNPNYVIVEKGGRLVNSGFDGIRLSAGDWYNLSLFGRTRAKLKVRLIDGEGNSVGGTSLNINSREWKKYEVVIRADKTVANAKLEIVAETAPVELDMISLFPQKTFKGRKNGLRSDLAQLIADIKPRFVRFPGGCVAHGNGLHNIYHWKHSIGPLESRKPDRNIWGYHQTKGLGFFEYFLFCEDIGATPLPVLAAGVPCQNSAAHGHTLAGQQGGIPMDEMESYIQDILDLIEYANGDARTTEWGRKRAASGHPQPFNLRYLGIGNEDLISEVFKERFTMIVDAVRKKYPEIQIIGTSGPFYEGSDYEFGWQLASELKLDAVDEHYYVPPGWMIHNQDFYDRYDRSKPKVYLGEYAAHLPGRPSNIETALAEALHLCNLERNADMVTMTSYAPLLAKEGRTQWRPDLIYFNNTELKPTVNYEVQKMFGNNSGDEYIVSEMELPAGQRDANLRIAKSVVRDTRSGDIIVKLANLLPVDITVNLSGIDSDKVSAVEKILLQGAPEDKNARALNYRIEGGMDQVVVPKYAFTILRFKSKP